MSRTEVKNGSKVQRAIHHLSVTGSPRGHVYVTVGQVAAEAGVSRPTTLKYLKVLQEHNLVVMDRLFNGMYMVAWRGA